MVTRSRRLCLVSHCLLNCNSKLEGSCSNQGQLKKVIYALMEKNYGIIQLPCPEISYYGMKRWGHVREQFDHPFFRKHCRSSLEPLLMQVQEYLNNCYTLDFVVGINGSPSCGVELSCSSDQWFGELSKCLSLDSLKKALEYKPLPGIFMEVLMDMLEEQGIKTQFVGISEGRIDEYDFATLF